MRVASMRPHVQVARSVSSRLLKAMFGSGNEDDASAGGGLGHGFFSLTQDEDEVTLIMDERCRACFDEARPVARVEPFGPGSAG